MFDMRVVPSRICAGTSVWTVTSRTGPMRPPFCFRSLSGVSPEKQEGRGQERQDGGHGEGERPDRPFPAPHLGCVVEAREGFGRFFDAEELAQRPPALSDLEDEKLLGRHAPLDLLVVPFEDLYGVLPIVEPPVEGTLPADVVAHPADPEHAGNEEADEREDRAREPGAGGDLAYPVYGVARALVPPLGVAH